MILGWAHALIVLVALQRLGELVYARRNTAALLARGAREVAPGHYPAMVLLHTAWIAALFALTEPNPAPQWLWLAVFALCQALRVAVLANLGPYWTTRIIVLDGAPPVRTGLYRYIRHPNYLIVAFEVPALPLGLGMPRTALVFGILNLLVLAWRIRAEDAARRGIA
jgi:methyltransferase